LANVSWAMAKKSKCLVNKADDGPSRLGFDPTSPYHGHEMVRPEVAKENVFLHGPTRCRHGRCSRKRVDNLTKVWKRDSVEHMKDRRADT
jgi:hypothetical protein